MDVSVLCVVVLDIGVSMLTALLTLVTALMSALMSVWKMQAVAFTLYIRRLL